MAQNNDKKLDLSFLDTRQPTCDGFFLLYNTEIREYFWKAIDVKLGGIKNYGVSNVYPIVSEKDNIKREIFNYVNFDQYFQSKLDTLTSLLSNLNQKGDILRPKFIVLESLILDTKVPLLKKLTALNDFNKQIILSRSGINFNSEFSVIFSIIRNIKKLIRTSGKCS